MPPKDADRMANSVDPDQELSNLGLHCFLRPVYPNCFMVITVIMSPTEGEGGILFLVRILLASA